MRPCWYAFQGVACILSPYGAFTEKPPALPGDVYFQGRKFQGQNHGCFFGFFTKEKDLNPRQSKLRKKSRCI